MLLFTSLFFTFFSRLLEKEKSTTDCPMRPAAAAVKLTRRPAAYSCGFAKRTDVHLISFAAIYAARTPRLPWRPIFEASQKTKTERLSSQI
jgi:hypothetical protein